MTDEELLDLWNSSISVAEDHRARLNYTATEIAPGKPQLEFFEPGCQWTPRGQVVRCQILSDGGTQPAVDEPFVSVDGRDFTLGEFMTMVGTFGGWGMRLEFVPEDELHQRPKLKVQAADSKKPKTALAKTRR